jgi:hypothetical protein
MHATRFIAFALALLAVVAGTSFADPTTAVVTISKGLNQCPSPGWGVMNAGTPATPGLFAPTNIWPDKSAVGKILDKAATKLGSTTFTCTLTYDPDFQIADACGIGNVLVIKITGCHL